MRCYDKRKQEEYGMYLRHVGDVGNVGFVDGLVLVLPVCGFYSLHNIQF
jgi:hypothetical protein